jgi:hypothetical protein
VGRILRFTLIGCSTVLVLAVALAGCGQANSPTERQEKKEGAEQAVREPPQKNPTPDTTMSQAEIDAAKEAAADVEVTRNEVAAASATALAQASASAAIWREEQGCRMERCADLKGMDRQERRAFAREIVDYLAEHERSDVEDALDAMGVPLYTYCEVGSRSVRPLPTTQRHVYHKPIRG